MYPALHRLNRKQHKLFQSLSVSRADFDAMIRHEQEVVTQAMRHAPNSVFRQLTVRTGVEAVTFMLTEPFETDDDKIETVRDCGEQCREMRLVPKAILFVTEVWLNQNKGVDPATDPGREEGVAVFAHSMAGALQGWTAMTIGRTRSGLAMPGQWREVTLATVPVLWHFWLGFAGRRETANN